VSISAGKNHISSTECEISGMLLAPGKQRGREKEEAATVTGSTTSAALKFC